jgi:hypothetical protein
VVGIAGSSTLAVTSSAPAALILTSKKPISGVPGERSGARSLSWTTSTSSAAIDPEVSR